MFIDSRTITNNDNKKFKMNRLTLDYVVNAMVAAGQDTKNTDVPWRTLLISANTSLSSISKRI
jgi:hypothetical protein